MKFWWPFFLGLKFTFLFLNLAKIHFFIPKSAYGGVTPGLGYIPKKTFFSLTASLIVIVGGSRLHKVRRGNVLSDLSGFKCPRSLKSTGTNIWEQISKGKKCQMTPVCISMYVWQTCVGTKMFVLRTIT